MNSNILLTLQLLFHITRISAQNDCAPFDFQNQGAVKIILYTKLNECFILSDENGEFKSPSTTRFTFRMEYSVKKINVAIGNEIVSKKIFATNQNLSTLVFELVKNEKKAKYEINAKLFENESSEQAQISFQKQVQKEEDKKKKRSEDWNLKMEEKRNEKEAEDDTKKSNQNSVTNQTNINSNEQTIVKKSTLNAKPVNDTLNISLKTDPSGTPHKFQFTYNDIPISNRMFILKSDDGKNQIMMKGSTDKNGYVTMYSTYNSGIYDVEIHMDKNGKLTKPTSYKLTITNNSNNIMKYDYETLIQYMMKATGKNRKTLEEMYGLE